MAVQPNNMAKKLAPISEFDALLYVATVPYICARWGKSRGAVMNMIDTDQFAAEKLGGTWIVALSSVIRVWGIASTIVFEFD